MKRAEFNPPGEWRHWWIEYDAENPPGHKPEQNFPWLSGQREEPTNKKNAPANLPGHQTERA